MKTPKHVEEKVTCDECGKVIHSTNWYRIFLNETRDFCTQNCATKFRDSFYRIIIHEEYPRIIGNTD